MYFLNNELMEIALNTFTQIDPDNPGQADWFFRTFCPGNLVYSSGDSSNQSYPDRPFERFSDYEEILRMLFEKDPNKYRRIHKGTPFFFMSWLSIHMHNYKKALYYMDAAISEDSRISPDNWINAPAGSFLILNSQNHVAQFTIELMKTKVSEQLTRFNGISNLQPLTLDKSFINRFIKILINNPQERSIISALYIYILEYDDRYDELKLRSNAGGSIEPILTHLFSGGLILESLLKRCYPGYITMGGILKYSSSFESDFSKISDTSASSLSEILHNINDDTFSTAFTTAVKLRNTTGHNLVWDNIFSNYDNYKKLFEQLMSAILYLIDKRF